MRSHVVIASNALLAIVVSLSIATTSAIAQSRVQFPSPYQSAPPLVPVNPNIGGGGFAAPGARLGGTIQPFDPYALPGNLRGLNGVPSAPFFPGQVTPGQYAPTFPPPPQSVWPGQAPSSLSVGPLSNVPPGAPLSPGYSPPGLVPPSGSPYGAPTAPLNGRTNDPYFRGSPYDANPTRAYGNAPNAYGGSGSFGDSNPTSGAPYQRLFQDTGLRGTYLFGREKDDFSLTEAEASTTAFFPNFLGVPNGLRVTPGFAFHWTNGPQAPETSDVPARLYSGYVDFGLEPQFTPRLSAELSARAGIYTDFQSFDADSIRLLGTGVGVYQASPEFAVKVGVAYIDRVKYKLLPAAGILWTPNPQTRWDIFFPAPKLSNYWTTLGNQQVWWYLGGEYGGGSWSIEREEDPEKGKDERIDINDIRIYAGIEWWNLNRYYGFAEIGYVFDREIVYWRVPGDSLNVDDTFMVRAGVSW